MSPERDLLFGLLALQNGFISRDQLVAAFGSWTADKRRRLDQILKEHGALDDATLQLMSALVERHLSLHGNDPAQSLAKLSSIGPSARQELGRLNDDQLKTCLTLLPAVKPSDGDEFLPTVLGDVGQSSAAGRFIILRPHAAGGLGQVAVALDKELHREVALKEIRPEHANERSARTRFIREAEITGGLEHPGIVPVYGLGTYADGRPYYAMKFVKGRSLKTALDEFHQKHPDPTAADYQGVEFRQLLQRFIDVCNAMQYAHDRGVLHRDLKPGNIMLGQYGETLVIDWGLAKPLGEAEPAFAPTTAGEKPLIPQSSGSDAGAETQPGSAIGTPQYMSPEQAAGQLDDLGPATDVYSLGATLYHVLTGKPPIERREGENLGDLLSRVQTASFPKPRQLKQKIPCALEAICIKAMVLKSTDRYGTPTAFAADLEHWLADEPVTVVSESLPQRVGRMARRHKSLAASGTVALIVVSFVSLVAFLIVDRERQYAVNLSIESEKARKDAELQRITAVNERNRSELLGYASGIANARRALGGSQPDLAMTHLSTCSATLRSWEHDYLMAQCSGKPTSTQITVPATEPTTNYNYFDSMTFSPDGRWLLTGSRTGIVRVFGTSSGKEILRLRDQRIEILAVAFNPDGTRFAHGDGLGEIAIRDVRTGAKLLTLDGHKDEVTCLKFSADGSRLFSGSIDTFVYVWDATSGSRLAKFQAHDSEVTCIDHISSTNELVSSGGDHVIKVWDLTSNSCIQTLIGHSDSIAATSTSRDGTRIASGDRGGRILIWDRETGSKLLELRTSPVRGLTFTSDGARIIASMDNRPITVWDSRLGQELYTLDGTELAISGVAMSSDGRRLAASLNEGCITIWDARQTRPLRWVQRIVMKLAFAPNGNAVASAELDGTVRIWDPESGLELQMIRAHPLRIHGLAFDRTSGRLATASADHTGKVWDAHTGRCLLTLNGHAGAVQDIAFSSDGKWITTASSDKTARIWDAETGMQAHVLSGHALDVLFASFDRSSTVIVTGGADGTVRTWSVSDGREKHVVQASYSSFYGVSFSADVSRIAVGLDDHTVRIVRTADLKEMLVLQGHRGELVNSAFSQDGMRLVTAGRDGIVKLWDVESGKELVTLDENMAHVGNVVFSPNASKIAFSRDNIVGTWDISSTSQIWSDAEAERSEHRAVPRLNDVHLNMAASHSNGAETIPGWGTFIDPDGDCSALVDNGLLRITVPVSTVWHDLNPSIGLNAPRVVSSVDGDFSIRVKVTADFMPGDSFKTTTQATHLAGLVIWQDESNFVRLERGTLKRKQGPLDYWQPLFEYCREGAFYSSPRVNVPSEFSTSPSVYLRLDRIDQVVMSYYSHDGREWTFVSKIDWPSNGKLWAGVKAGGAGKKEFRPSFGDLSITPISEDAAP